MEVDIDSLKTNQGEVEKSVQILETGKVENIINESIN